MRFITLALLCLVIACGDSTDKGGPDTPSTKPKKIFQFMRQEAYKSLDPVKQFDSASAELIQNVYDSLLEYDYLARPYRMVPNLLAKMPELSADGLTYSFELRSDVRFIDDPCFPGGKGRPLVTDDVIYSLKRFADARLNIKSYTLWQGAVQGMNEFREQTQKGADMLKLDIAGIKKIDDHKFTITLTQKNPLALFPLAATQTAIVAREAVEKYGAEFEQHPVGTGPFKIKTLQRRGVTILEKNPNYHGVYPSEGEPSDEAAGLLAPRGQKVPFIDEVHLPLIEEPQPAMLKFLSGKMDWVAMDRDNFGKMGFKDEKGFHLRPDYVGKYAIYSAQMLTTEYWSFNTKDPLVGKNKALRQAFAYALDIPTMLEKLENGRGVATKSIVPPDIAGSERDTKAEGYSNNLELAKQKLVEAGYPGGKGLPPITIEYRASTTRTRQQFEWNRAELEKAGIILKANFQTFSAYLQRIESGNFQIGISGWQADYPDAENFYALLYGPNKRPGPNEADWVNAEYDKLYEQTRFMPNGPERFALFARMNEIVREEVPAIITYTQIVVGLRQNWVKNFKRNVMIDTPFKYFDIDPTAQAKGIQGAK
jgi:ABC-type transport system substrate-binding protein